MLDIALQFLKDELNSYIIAKTGSNSFEVKLTKIVDEAGKYAFPDDTIGVTLINIEEERVMKEHLPKHTLVNGQHVVLEPELRLNLHIMVALNFQQYDQALKYLSYVMTFFQAHSVFAPDHYPALDSRIVKLIAEIQSLSYEQLNQIWASLGAKQLPCMIYKVRMVILQDTEPDTVQPPITTIDTTLQSK
ncbi:MAG TPA: DUF4255 domain-containing protein [Candidatus Kapabacteria bacterium]|nr:DUF4255 domain-containing protein [Candidatus Kapabacteria bacterium]